MEQRHKGFVVAGDKRESDGKIIWKVRVKDEESSYNGKKFIVASVHGNIELSKGLNVTFLIGSIGDNGKKVERAVDVALQEDETLTGKMVTKGKKEFNMKNIVTILIACTLMLGCEKKPAKVVEKVADVNATEKVTAVEPNAVKEERGPGGFGERRGTGRRGFDPASMLKSLDPNDIQKIKEEFPAFDPNDPNTIKDQDVMGAIRNLVRARGPGGFAPGGFSEVRAAMSEPNVAEPNLINLNLAGVKMDALIQKLATLTGKSIIVPDELSAMKVGIIYSPTKVSKETALQLIYRSLAERGYARVEDANTNSITFKPIADAKLEAIPVIEPNVPLTSIKDLTLIVQKTFQLESYSAGNMAKILEPLVSQARQIIAEEASRKIIVIDAVENLIRIEKLIKQLDIPESGLDIEFQRIPVETDAEKIARQVNQLLGTETTTGTRRTSTSFREGFGGRGSEFQPTPQATAEARQQTTTTQRGAGATAVSISTSRGTIILIPDVEGRWIFARANSTDMRTIEKLVKMLDVKVDVESQMDVVPLTYANPTQLADSIEESIRGMPAETRINVAVGGIELTKSILITGSKEARDFVKEAIERLDVPPKPLDQKTWHLNFTDVDELTTILQQLYLVTDTSSSRTRGFTPFGFRQETTREEIYVSTLSSRNDIIVRASTPTLEKISELIEFVDQYVKPALPVTIYLDNTDPVKIAPVLNEMFATTSGAATTRTTSNIFDLMFGGRSSEVAAKLIGTLAGKVKFMAVPDTKKVVLISKIPEYNEDLVNFVKDLDKAKIAEMPAVEELKYANPWNVAELLNALFNKEGTTASIRRPETELEYTIQTGTETTTTGQATTTAAAAEYRPPWSQAGARTTTGEEMPISNVIGKVRFVPDSRSKSVLVLAPSELIPEIRILIQQLDKPGKQVMIRAVVVEVDRSKMDSIGVQIASDPTAFGVLGENSLKALSQITQKESHGSMVFGAAGNSGSNIALNTGASINVLVDFLVKKAGAKITNEQILSAKDGESAEFFKGETDAFVSGTTISGTTGTLTQNYVYREIGMTLRVRPNITPEKNVDMKIDISLSQLSQVTVNTQPKQPNTRATNTMIVKDGETVLLASILSGEDSSINRKIPGLGDLPLIGGLFRHDSVLKSRSEMLVFITPTVVDEDSNPQDIPEIKKAVDKMEEIKSHLDEVAEWLEKTE